MNYKKHLVLANSHYTANEIQAYSGKSAEVLYPPFSSSLIDLSQDTAKPQKDNLVVTVSRLDANKQLERIPQIAAQTHSSIQFVIIGRLCSPTTLAFLHALTKKLGVDKRVHFYPDASVEQKIDLLRKAKIYLHTMTGEHFGISIVEAMVLGCLPIVHDSGGVREFVSAQYRYQTSKEAASKISQVLACWSNNQAEKVRALSEQFSLSNFSIRFMELYMRYYD